MGINGFNGVPFTSNPARLSGVKENYQYFEEKNFIISGVTRDSNGFPLGGCTVNLFYSSSNILAQTTISDGSGNYSFTVDKTVQFYEVSYKAGAPDVAGTSVNTLAGS